jgi:hypothetical protein
MKICIIKLGDWVEGLISVLTLGRGKDMATWIAHKLGFKSCGCDERKAWLNKIVGCFPSQIKLDLDATKSTTEERTYSTDRPQNNHPLRDI